ncbi:hypothetical protein Gotur_029755 [Gossypium turneri]
MVKKQNFLEGDSTIATKATWDDDLGWCPFKKTVDATEEWWAEKIQENLGFKGFKKKGIEPGLNELMWQMFGDIVVTGEHA